MSSTSPWYRWYLALCVAHGVNPDDAEWVKWAEEEWGHWLACTPVGRVREFQRCFDRRLQQAQFRRDAAARRLN